jgi:glucose dehydrogenase
MWAINASADARHTGRRRAATLVLVPCLLCGSHALEALDSSAPEDRTPRDASASQQLRFSALEELTPQNVRQLRPLFAVRASIDSAPRSTAPSDRPTRAAAAPLGSPAAADAHLRRFVAWRATLIRAPLVPAVPSPAVNPAIAYVLSPGAPLASAVAAAPQAAAQVTAWEPVTGHVLWSARDASRAGAGAMVTAGGLVFYCSTDGLLKALDARSGDVLWQQRLTGGKHGEPFSYEGSDGHQYVGVLTDATGKSGTLQSFSLPH